MNTTRTTSVKLSVEVITLPVSDVERALRFCRPGRLHAQRRLSPNYAFHVVQLTPPGSSCSIQSVAGSSTRPSDQFATSISW
jgi:hypothetical protein